MVTPPPSRAHPRLLVIGAEEPVRRGLVTEVFGQATSVAVFASSAGALPDPRAFDSVVVDGEPSLQSSPEWTAQLEEAVSNGASLVALLGSPLAGAGEVAPTAWTRWLGLARVSQHERTEWFAKIALGGAGLAERLPGEFSVFDSPVTFDPGGESVPIVQVSIGFTDRTVMAQTRVGQGRIVVCGLGAEPAGLASRELATVARRAILPMGETPRQRPVGFAVLGYGPYGGMGLYHGLAAAATAGLEMIAACDSDPARRKAAEEEFPGVRPYANVSELIADDDIEVVVVATPPSTHFELATALLGAGKHVCLEKPMCLTVAQADTMIAMAADARRVLTVHQSRRFDPDYLAVKRAVDRGDLGELFNVETFVGGFEHPCRAWHSEVSISGGAVYDWGSHYLDWTLQLMGGFPESLWAHGHKRVWHDITNLDQVRVHLTWADGREAEFVQSDVAGIRRPKFFLQGTKGTLAGHYRPLRFERLEPGVGYVGESAHHAEAPVELVLARYEPGYGLTETLLPPAETDRYGFHRNLADHLLLGEPLAVTPESAREVVALLEAAQASTDGGNVPVRLRPPGEVAGR